MILDFVAQIFPMENGALCLNRVKYRRCLPLILMAASINALRVVADIDIMNEGVMVTFLDVTCLTVLHRVSSTKKQDFAFGTLRWDELGREQVNGTEYSHEGEKNAKIPSIGTSK